MVAHLLRLKLTLLRNSLRRSPWQIVGLVLGALYGIGMLVLLLAGLFFLSLNDPELARTVTVLAGTLVVLGWALIPVLATGVDLTLDPARFVTFAVPLPKMLTGLALGGLIGIPGAVTLLAGLASAAIWWRNPAALAAGVVAALIAVFTCLIAARVTVAASTSLSNSRRFKDVAGLVAIIPLMLLGPIIAGVSSGIGATQGYLPSLANTLSWTPLGAAWSVPGDVALGQTGQAAAKLAIAAGFLALLVWVWKVLLLRALHTPPHNAGPRRKAGKLGFFSLFPPTPAGAVAARALTYWIRDPRYGASLLIIPLLAVLLVFVGSNQEGGGPQLLLVMGPLVAFLLAFGISADVAYDNTAFALHISTGVSGTADRAGRVIACAVFALPATVLAVLVPCLMLGEGDLIPVLLGVSLAILLGGFGLSSVVSARYTYNVPLPGENAFKTPPGSGGRTMLVQGLGMLAQIVIVFPVLALAVTALLSDNPVWDWATLAGGILLGAGLLVAGIRIGGKWLDRRAPELLAAVSVHK
ncbi:transporter [Arthrobacter sp. zg-ZUI100]|uniref:transporter n=1 Tax=Arthrobacter jiangjiafuii TaxID=2817475 RepID=UPI001AEDCE9F|nr:transporter [Arthrobacter jiangjiafuii]MBP3034699.1 transporter [Arthrobacter jiangjiafuii]